MGNELLEGIFISLLIFAIIIGYSVTFVAKHLTQKSLYSQNYVIMSHAWLCNDKLSQGISDEINAVFTL